MQLAFLLALGFKHVDVGVLEARTARGCLCLGCMQSLCELDVVTLVLSNIKRTLKMAVVPDPPPPAAGEEPAAPAEGVVYEGARNRYQVFLLGALSVLLVDRNCRRPYLLQEPDYATLFMLCKNLEG